MWCVSFNRYFALCHDIAERRPTTARGELVFRVKEYIVTHDTRVNTLFLHVKVFTTKWPESKKSSFNPRTVCYRESKVVLQLILHGCLLHTHLSVSLPCVTLNWTGVNFSLSSDLSTFMGHSSWSLLLLAACFSNFWNIWNKSSYEPSRFTLWKVEI